MASRGHALSRDALIRTLTAYNGITTADGAVDGTTLVDSNLISRNEFISEKTILIMSGDAKDEDKGALSFVPATGVITLQGTGFSAQIKAGTIFRVLNISTVEMDVATIDGKIGTNTDPVGTTTLFAWLLKIFEHGGQGGFYYGKVTQIDDATHFRVAGLTGFGDAYFANTYRVYVVRDAAGLGAAPQGEMQPCSEYDSDDGIFTYTAFTAALAVDDEVLLIHERIAEIADLVALIGTAADNADLATLFARANKIVLPTHAHALLVVHDAANLDADLDTALRDWMLGLGYQVTIADPADVAVDLDVDAFDFIVVSGSCLVGDAGNLANLREANAPVLCHSAAIAVAVFFLGGTAGSEATQTQIEIIDNSPAWLIDVATGDLTVTASATIQTMETKATNATTKAEEASGIGADLTIVKLKQGLQDGGSPTYAPFYDRYFNGVADYTNANAVWKALMAGFLHHMLHEKRFGEGTVQLKRVPQEQIPDTDFALAAIDDTLTADPPSADAENSIVDLDQRVNLTYVLRSLWVNVTSFGTAGTQLTFQLWVLLNGSVTSVDSVVVDALGIQNLMDIFGLQEVHADGIWITVITDSGSADAACSGTYRYAEARK